MYFNKGGTKLMTVNKEELIKLILENDNLDQAVLTAASIIFDFLKLLESSEAQTVACQQVCGQMNPSL